MKICITAKSPSPLSAMDNDFEKCAYFTFFVEGKMGFEATINNQKNNMVQLLREKGVNVLITKNINSRSLTKLNNANIKVFTDLSKLITDAFSRFRNGELILAQKTDVNSYLQKMGAGYIIAGGMGQRTQMLFNENGIKTVMGITGRIEEILNQICNGTLQGGESLCAPGAGKGYGIDKTECDHDEHDHL